jgi:hypothetical protein
MPIPLIGTKPGGTLRQPEKSFALKTGILRADLKKHGLKFWDMEERKRKAVLKECRVLA